MTLGGLIGVVDDKLNPIVVKELRQAVQSKFVVAVLFLFLLLELLVAGVYLVVNSEVRGLGTLESQDGHTLFMILQGVMLGTCMLCLPLYAGIRLAAERSQTHVDLLFVTTLPPRAIVGGKLLATLIVTMLIFSACTPFMFFTYFLRGIDWPTIIFVVTVDFLTVAFAVMISIFLSLVPAHWVIKALLAMLGFLVSVMLLYTVLGLTINLLLFEGVGALMETRRFWGIVCCTLAGTVGVSAVLYAWSAALLNPPSANRAFLWRVTSVIVWGVGLAIAWTWSVLLRDVLDPLIIPWMVCAAIMTMMGMIIAINERESWTPRVSRTIPRQWWLRPLAFLFYSGGAGGMVLSGLLFAATVFIARYGDVWFGPSEPQRGLSFDPLERWSKAIMVTGLYILAYALTALLIRRLSFGRIPAVHTWVVMLGLLALGCLVPFLMVFLVFYGQSRYESQYYWMLPNPIAALTEVFGFGRSSPRERHFLMTASIWAVVGAVLNVPWLLQQLWAFRPYRVLGESGAAAGLKVELTSQQAATTKTV